MKDYAYGPRSKTIILLTAAVHGLLGAAGLAFAVVLLWNVTWPEKSLGVPLALFATGFLVGAWAHVYLLAHPPTMTVCGDAVLIRAWPLLRETLALERDDVRRIDRWERPVDAGDDVALLAPPLVRPNVIVRLSTTRSLPVNPVLCAVIRFAGRPMGSEAQVPTRTGQYDAIGLNNASEVRQPDGWPYPLR